MNTTNNTVRFLLVADIHNSKTDGLDPTGCDAAIVAGDFKHRAALRFVIRRGP